MSISAIEREVAGLLEEEIRIAEARLVHTESAEFADGYRREIRLKTAALLLLGGADPSQVTDKVEALK